MLCAVILAGGKSRRMGRDKLMLPYGGKTMLEAAVERFSQAFDRVYISVASQSSYPGISAERVVDIFPNCGPMGGLHAALSVCPGEGVFLAAADLPFSSPEAAKKIIALCGASDAAMLVDGRGRCEPTFAYYKKTLLPAAEKLLEDKNYRMTALFDSGSVRKIQYGELGELWSEKILDNINFPEDYQRILAADGNDY